MRMLVAGAATLLISFVAVSAQAAGSFDGVYEGNGSVLSGRCPPPTHPVFRVADNHISSKFGGTNVVDADVAPDGTLKNGPAALKTITTGTISGKTLTMDVTLQACAYHYVLEKHT